MSGYGKCSMNMLATTASLISVQIEVPRMRLTKNGASKNMDEPPS